MHEVIQCVSQLIHVIYMTYIHIHMSLHHWLTVFLRHAKHCLKVAHVISAFIEAALRCKFGYRFQLKTKYIHSYVSCICCYDAYCQCLHGLMKQARFCNLCSLHESLLACYWQPKGTGELRMQLKGDLGMRSSATWSAPRSLDMLHVSHSPGLVWSQVCVVLIAKQAKIHSYAVTMSCSEDSVKPSYLCASH